MKLLKVVLVLLLIGAVAAAGAWFLYFDSPQAVANEIAAQHEAHPDFDEDLDTWSNALSTLGLPFQAVSELRRVVDGVDRARAVQVDVAGVVVRPWEAVQGRVPGAEVIDSVLGAATDVVRLSDAIDEDLRGLEHAAEAYAEARAALQADPTREHVAATCAAAAALQVELDQVQDKLQPVVAAVGQATASTERAQVWLDEVTPSGVQEGLVIQALRQTIRIADTAVNGPAGRLVEFSARVQSSSALMETISHSGDNLRPDLSGAAAETDTETSADMGGAS